MSTHNDEIPPFEKAVVRDRKGDLSKEWYVEFYALDRGKGQLSRMRRKIPTRLKTAKQRLAYAKDLINEINDLLKNGYHFVSGQAIEGKAVPTKKENLPVLIESPITLRSLVEQALKMKARQIRDKSYKTYSSNANKFLKWLGPNDQKGIDFITKSIVAEYRDFLLDSEGISSNTTVNNIFNITKGFFLVLKEREIIKENPFVYSKLGQTESFRNKAFTPADQIRMEEAIIQNYPLYIFTRFMYYNFIRPTELRRIKIRDIDFDRRTILVYGDGAKNHKSATIPLHPNLYELIKDYELLPRNFYVVGKGLVPNLAPASENMAYTWHSKFLEDTEHLEDDGYTLYSWRHCGAVRAYEAGTDIKTLQFLFRHSSIVQTEIYLKSLRLQLNRVVLKSW